MPQVERLWKDEEIIGMNLTISLLRRMRSAAVTPIPSRSLRFHRALNHFFRENEEIHPPQEALADAQHLATAAGDFFAATISRTAHSTTEFQKWQDFLSDSQKQYNLYTPITYARSILTDVVGNSLIGRMRNLHIDPDYTINWELLKNNNLGAHRIRELLELNIGIFSPLSGDYLMANVYSAYLRRTRDKTFALRTVALSQDLSEMTLPITDEGLPFEEKNIIGIYIDTVQTGNTGRILFAKLQEMYPQKRILPPREEDVPFTPSGKIEKYWQERS